MLVHYAQRDAVPVTRVAVSFNAGSAADPVDKRGLESLALGLFDEGTTTLTSQQIAETRERLGASITTGGGTRPFDLHSDRTVRQIWPRRWTWWPTSSAIPLWLRLRSSGFARSR